jgi:hypothetical protein
VVRAGSRTEKSQNGANVTKNGVSGTDSARKPFKFRAEFYSGEEKACLHRGEGEGVRTGQISDKLNREPCRLRR